MTELHIKKGPNGEPHFTVADGKGKYFEVKDGVEREVSVEEADEWLMSSKPVAPVVTMSRDIEASDTRDKRYGEYVGLIQQWSKLDYRGFMFATYTYPTRTDDHVPPPVIPKVINMGGVKAVALETAFEIIWDERGEVLRDVVAVLEKPDSLRRMAYKDVSIMLAEGNEPKPPLRRITNGAETLGYLMGTLYYQDLLALFTWLFETYQWPQGSLDGLRVFGATADTPEQVRWAMLKDIKTRDKDDSMVRGMSGMSVSHTADRGVSLNGVLLPRRRMRQLRQILLERIPDFFERVRTEEIPDGPGTAWMDYLERVLGDKPGIAPEVDTVADKVAPAEEIPAAVVTIEEVPTKDLLNRLFGDNDLDQDLRDAFERDLQRIVLKEPEMVPVEEPVAEEFPVEVRPVQDAEVVAEVVEPEVTEVETPVERKVRQRRERVAKLKPEAILVGMDADTLWDEVMTNPQGYFAFTVEGPARVTPEVRAFGTTQRREVSVEKMSDGCRYQRVVDLEAINVRSLLALMEWGRFEDTVEPLRDTGRRWWEHAHGDKGHLGFSRSPTIYIDGSEISLLPSLVAGLYRDGRDRLGVVCLVMRHKFQRFTTAERAAMRAEGKLKKPDKPLMRVKRTRKGVAYWQNLYYMKVERLAVFPSGWLSVMAEIWMYALLGTPYDPTLLRFCKDMPEEWWEGLRRLTPTQKFEHLMIDVRALQP